MAQNSQPLDLAEALQQLFVALPGPTQTQTIPLTEALGRILATPVFAALDLPPFAASAMDGYAIRLQDLDSKGTSTFHVCATSLAGHPCTHELQAAQAVRIFTGAKVPAGADQVLLQEDANACDAEDHISFDQVAPSESYIRPQGHDVVKGTQLAAVHERLTAFSLGTLSAAGVDQVEVFAKPKIGVFSSGDELVSPGIPAAQLKQGQIYDSNRLTVLNLLADTPCELLDLGCLADDEAQVESAMQNAAEQCDILLTSGGVSVGDADFITKIIARLGHLEFWRLNLKPGKPMAFGQINNCHVFGLPGNPVSTIVTLLMVAKPAIWHLAGAHPTPPLRVQATLSAPLSHAPGRAEYQRGTFTISHDDIKVHATSDQSSNRLSSFQSANCLIEIDKDQGNLAAGARVKILPFSGLLS